jgi:hypothetical protein
MSQQRQLRNSAAEDDLELSRNETRPHSMDNYFTHAARA